MKKKKIIRKSNKKRGFTLVELLATIAVLALLALITLPVVDNMLDKNKERVYTQNIETTKDALRNWANENTTLLPEDGETRVLTLQTLKEEGLIDTKFKNPKTKKCYSNSSILKIKNVSDAYTYEVNSLVDGLDTDCEDVEYTYFNETTSTEGVNMNNQPTTRPTNSRVYLKYPMNAPANTLPQVCMHDGYMELCLNSKNYEGSRTIIEEYVSFDPDNWETQDSLHSKISDNENTICTWNNKSINCIVSDQYQLEVTDAGRASISDFANNISCVISNNNAYCETYLHNAQTDPIVGPSGGSIKPNPGAGYSDPTDGSI